MAEIPHRRPSLIALGRTVYGLRPAVTWSILLFPIVSMLGFGLALYYPPAYERTIRMLAEDRQVENTTVYAYLVAIVPALIMAARMWARRRPLAVIGFVWLALLCFGLAGEEIAWGQRILHFHPPAFFKSNVQHEATIHNFPIFQLFSAWYTLVLGAVGLIAILAHTPRRQDASGVPSLIVTYGWVIVLMSGCDDFNQWVFLDLKFSTEIGRLQELVEMLFAFALMIGAWLALRRDTRRRSAAAG
jgi:hypothetical protein